MLVGAPFKFLSMDEFERLGSGEKLAYLSDAMEKLERAKVPRDIRGWHILFTQQQQQQQLQPKPKDDTKPE